MAETQNPSPAAPENQNQNPQNLTLKTKDGKEFQIPRSAGELSRIIMTAVEVDGDGDGVVLVPDVDVEVLSKVISYLKVHGDASVSAEDKKKFDKKFVESVDLSFIADILLAANFLEIKSLLDLVAKKLADTLENKSVNWVRGTFGIVNDYTADEEEAQKKEAEWAHEGVDPDDFDDADEEAAAPRRRRRID